MLENTHEHKCANHNENGLTEPPDIPLDWLSSTPQLQPGSRVQGEFIPFCPKVMDTRPLWAQRNYIIE